MITDQVIRENPTSRGNETSAEVLIGPPWRIWSRTPVNSSGTRLTLGSGRRPRGTPPARREVKEVYEGEERKKEEHEKGTNIAVSC